MPPEKPVSQRNGFSRLLRFSALAVSRWRREEEILLMVTKILAEVEKEILLRSRITWARKRGRRERGS